MKLYKGGVDSEPWYIAVYREGTFITTISYDGPVYTMQRLAFEALWQYATNAAVVRWRSGVSAIQYGGVIHISSFL